MVTILITVLIQSVWLPKKNVVLFTFPLNMTHLRHNLLIIHILGKQSGMEKGLPEISHVEPLKSCYLIPSSLKLGKHP